MKNKLQYIKEPNIYARKISLNNVRGKEILENIGKELGSFLKVMIMSLKPENILEIGTGCGYATSVILQASKDYPKKLITVEIDKERLYKTKKALSDYGYNNIEFVCQDMLAFLKKSKENYNFILLDANPFLYIEAFLEITKHQKKNDVLLVHDALIPSIPIAPTELKAAMDEFNCFLKDQDEYKIHKIALGDGFWFCIKN